MTDEETLLLGQVTTQVEQMSCKEARETLLDLILQAYTLVTYPESQDFLNEDWFEQEAILDAECINGPSAYFIPFHRLIPKIA